MHLRTLLLEKSFIRTMFQGFHVVGNSPLCCRLYSTSTHEGMEFGGGDDTRISPNVDLDFIKIGTEGNVLHQLQSEIDVLCCYGHIREARSAYLKLCKHLSSRRSSLRPIMATDPGLTSSLLVSLLSRGLLQVEELMAASDKLMLTEEVISHAMATASRLQASFGLNSSGTATSQGGEDIPISVPSSLPSPLLSCDPLYSSYLSLQMKNEDSCYISVQKLGFEKSLCDGPLPPDFKRFFQEWREGLAERWKYLPIDSQVTKAAFLRIINPQEAADMTLNLLTQYLYSGSMWISSLGFLSELGDQFYASYCRQWARKYGYLKCRLSAYPELCSKKIISSITHLNPCDCRHVPFEWPRSLRVYLSSHLLCALLQSAPMIPNRQAKPLSLSLCFKNNVRMQMIKVDTGFAGLCHRLYLMEDRVNIPSLSMPHLCPPFPWTTPWSGNYFSTPRRLVRGSLSVESLNALSGAVSSSSMSAVLHSLDACGKTAWRVNDRVLNTMMEVYRVGDSNPGLGMPPYPRWEEWQDTYLSKVAGSTSQAYTGANWIKLCDARHQHSERMTEWMRTHHCLLTACHLKGRPFWLPHDMDFRGRFYPIPTYGTHHDRDASRALLLFDKALPLGSSGLKWLKIHLTGLILEDVRGKTFEDRVAFCDSIIEKVRSTACSPLEHPWWKTVERPWQCLAACIELHEALSQKDPCNYHSRIPVRLDGSCNGLQHLAALGRCENEAATVNLCCSDRMKDVYSIVAEKVDVTIRREATLGNQAAILLQGSINRKLLKKLVMTYVYGLTRKGAYYQMLALMTENCTVERKDLVMCASYLSRLGFELVQEELGSSYRVMEWLKLVAACFTAQNKCVSWISPLGLPISQPYFEYEHTNIQTDLGSYTVFENIFSGEVVKPKEQQDSFPANFIHSLDASHMIMTCLECANQGITFASVHDSYWAHAANINHLNEILRKMFLKLHTETTLSSFYQEICQTLSPMVPPSPPISGKFDLVQVLNSPYFFS